MGLHHVPFGKHRLTSEVDKSLAHAAQLRVRVLVPEWFGMYINDDYERHDTSVIFTWVFIGLIIFSREQLER